MKRNPLHPSDEELVRRAIHSSGTPSARAQTPRWAAVMMTFGLGSTYSAELCVRFGFDPDESVRL